LFSVLFPSGKRPGPGAQPRYDYAVLGNIGEDPRSTLILTVHPELITAAP
jgi:hypothetical protein